MHKRNIALIAAVLALGVVLLFHFAPLVGRPEWVGLVYFPAILLSVILSGGSHSPEAYAGWSAFVANSLLYLVCFIVLYAFLLELWLLRRVRHHLDAVCAKPEARDLGASAYAEALGKALRELNTHRSRHWVLKEFSFMEGEDHGLGVEAIHRQLGHRAVRRLMGHLETGLVKSLGRPEANTRLMELRLHARHESLKRGRR